MHAYYACMHIMHACMLCMHAYDACMHKYYACMHLMHACKLCMHACIACMHSMHACMHACIAYTHACVLFHTGRRAPFFGARSHVRDKPRTDTANQGHTDVENGPAGIKRARRGDVAASHGIAPCSRCRRGARAWSPRSSVSQARRFAASSRQRDRTHARGTASRRSTVQQEDEGESSEADRDH